MPEISRFFGIIIRMFFGDHPPPHFHARYGKHKAKVGIESLTVLSGSLPPRAMGLVIEWAALHPAELRTAWELAVQSQPVQPIEPLE
jgi:hypothetical protein